VGRPAAAGLGQIQEDLGKDDYRSAGDRNGRTLFEVRARVRRGRRPRNVFADCGPDPAACRRRGERSGAGSGWVTQRSAQASREAIPILPQRTGLPNAAMAWLGVRRTRNVSWSPQLITVFWSAYSLTQMTRSGFTKTSMPFTSSNMTNSTSPSFVTADRPECSNFRRTRIGS